MEAPPPEKKAKEAAEETDTAAPAAAGDPQTASAADASTTGKEEEDAAAAGETVTTEAADSVIAVLADFHPLPTLLVEETGALLWGMPGALGDEDILRWHAQGFNFLQEPATAPTPAEGDASSSAAAPAHEIVEWKLKQKVGGPCGVLAAVQGEIVKDLLWQGGAVEQEVAELPGQAPLPPGSVLLARAMRSVLERAAPEEEVKIAIQSDDSEGGSGWKMWTGQGDAVQATLEALYPRFCSDTGVLQFVYSIVMTRGIDCIREDMDEPVSLVAQFGHCTQELLNLLLCGRAVSNVFDGERPLGDTGMSLKGVPRQADIGYLTHLESLRYCEVGDYYKVPRFPVWVIGSQSHFTVLFSLEKAVNKVSDAESLQRRVQQAFAAIDTDNCGFIMGDRLADFLRAMNSPLADDTMAVQRLRTELEIEGNLILFAQLWQTTSRLFTGASLDDVLQGATAAAGGASTGTDGAGGGAGAGATGAGPTTRPRSDSEIARELQAQFDADWPPADAPPAPAPAPEPAPAPAPELPRSDSDLARELQAQFDAEQQGTAAGGAAPTSATTAVGMETGAGPAPASSAAGSAAPATATTAAAAATAAPPPTGEAGTGWEVGPAMADVAELRADLHRNDSLAGGDDPGFRLYHFNGLQNSARAARLTAFLLRKRSDQDAVGHAVAMNTAETGTGGQMHQRPIEEVLRTRWNGCQFDWQGQELPSID